MGKKFVALNISFPHNRCLLLAVNILFQNVKQDNPDIHCIALRAVPPTREVP